MIEQIDLKNVKQPLLNCLDETFFKIHGMYLDQGTTFFETLDGITAKEASSAPSSASATIAAQLDHARLYLDVIEEYLRTKVEPKVNWREIWDTVREVTPDEWEALKQKFKDSHATVMITINASDDWKGQGVITGALLVLVHSAYHLGGIRQALGVIRASEKQ